MQAAEPRGLHEPDPTDAYEALEKQMHWPKVMTVHKNELVDAGKARMYVDWWMKDVEPGLRHVLREDGSVVVNIKENTIDGELSTYVYELVLAMKKAGWKWIDEYVWLKTAPSPGKWPNRLKCAWERCLHFGKTAKIELFHDQMLEENTETFDRWLESKMAKQAIETGYTTGSPHTDHSRNYGRFAKLEKTLPANVVVAPNASSSKTSSLHAAPYNPRVPGFFIALMTEEADLVLDPFAGTGTTCWQSLHMGRCADGIELDETYYNLYPKLVKEYGWSCEKQRKAP